MNLERGGWEGPAAINVRSVTTDDGTPKHVYGVDIGQNRPAFVEIYREREGGYTIIFGSEADIARPKDDRGQLVARFNLTRDRQYAAYDLELFHEREIVNSRRLMEELQERIQNRNISERFLVDLHRQVYATQHPGERENLSIDQLSEYRDWAAQTLSKPAFLNDLKKIVEAELKKGDDAITDHTEFAVKLANLMGISVTRMDELDAFYLYHHVGKLVGMELPRVPGLLEGQDVLEALAARGYRGTGVSYSDVLAERLADEAEVAEAVARHREEEQARAQFQAQGTMERALLNTFHHDELVEHLIKRMAEKQIAMSTVITLVSMAHEGTQPNLSEGYWPQMEYFKYLFTQIISSNKDSRLDADVMSLDDYWGSQFDPAGQIKIDHVMLRAGELDAFAEVLAARDPQGRTAAQLSPTIDCTFVAERNGGRNLADAIERIKLAAEQAALNGAVNLTLSDRAAFDTAGNLVPGIAPMEMPVVVAAVQEHLRAKGLLTNVSLTVQTAHVHDPFEAALLVTLGATAIDAYLLREIGKRCEGEDAAKYQDAEENLMHGYDYIIKTIMGPAGIASKRSYRDCHKVECVGLSPRDKEIRALFPHVAMSAAGTHTLAELEDNAIYYREQAERWAPAQYKTASGLPHLGRFTLPNDFRPRGTEIAQAFSGSIVNRFTNMRRPVVTDYAIGNMQWLAELGIDPASDPILSALFFKNSEAVREGRENRLKGRRPEKILEAARTLRDHPDLVAGSPTSKLVEFLASQEKVEDIKAASLKSHLQAIEEYAHQSRLRRGLVADLQAVLLNVQDGELVEYLKAFINDMAEPGTSLQHSLSRAQTFYNGAAARLAAD
ncbi:MAG: hypothetical protein J0L97_11335, partial [Alphaproteobacteria bacterium]|nr:hypothetical protein [Alphaproteobacteria bacterium]